MASIKDTGIKHSLADRYISKRRLEAYLEKNWPGGEGTHYAKRVRFRFDAGSISFDLAKSHSTQLERGRYGHLSNSAR